MEDTPHTTEDRREDTVHVFTSTQTESIDSGHIPVMQQLLLLASLLFLLFAGAVTPRVISFFQEEPKSVPASPILSDPQSGTPTDTQAEPVEPFSEIDITAEAAYVWDVREQRALYKKNETEALPLASVTKLMTALLAYELISDEEGVPIQEDAIRQYGNSGLLEGEVFDRLSLTDLVLMSSSNDGAYALASAAGAKLDPNNPERAFVYAMNIRAQELNLQNTSYKNPTGLDLSKTESGAIGSAKDMAFLMEYMIANSFDVVAGTAQTQARIYSNEAYHEAANTNYYIDQIPGLIASKTGYTDLAGGNLVVAFDAGLNRPIIVSVLGSTRNDRFTDVLQLVSEAQRYVAQN